MEKFHSTVLFGIKSSKLINSLKKCLNYIRKGKCMKREASELSAYLDLKIKDFGLVSLPLNKLQAEDLIKLCSQEPFG